MTDGIIVTVSREAYCGGDEFAKMLADKAGFKFYDREINFACFSKERNT